MKQKLQCFWPVCWEDELWPAHLERDGVAVGHVSECWRHKATQPVAGTASSGCVGRAYVQGGCSTWPWESVGECCWIVMLRKQEQKYGNVDVAQCLPTLF